MKDFSEMKRIVIKIGSSSLTHSGGGINFRKIDRWRWCSVTSRIWARR